MQDIDNKHASFNNLFKKVEAVRKKESFILFFGGLSLALAISLFILFLMVLIEFFAEGDTRFRTVLVGIFVVMSLIALGITTLPYLLRLFRIKNLPSINDIALRIGEAYPTIKDKLGNVLQLTKKIDNEDSNKGISTDLIAAAFNDVDKEVEDKDFSVIINKKKARKMLLLLLLALLITTIGINSSTDLSSAFFRLKNCSTEFIPPAPFTLELITKQDTVLRNSNVTLVFKAKGKAPNFIKLYLKEEQQQNYDDIKLRLDTGNIYKYEITALKQDIRFYGEATWLTSALVTDTGFVKITDRPIIRSFSGRLNYPNYTKLASKDFDAQTADLSALRGSSAHFNISTNKNIKSAEIVFEKSAMTEYVTLENETDIADSLPKFDTTVIPLKVRGNKASGAMKIKENGSYYFVLTDSAGLKNISPIKYSVVALSDDAPTISMLYPLSDVQVNEQAILPIKLSISDDYGFSSLILYYKMIASKYSMASKNYSAINIPLPKFNNNLTVEVPYVWDLTELDIMPEDIYEFYIEIADNDLVMGPKKARTQILTVRLPSLEEVAKEADMVQEKVVNDLQKLKKETEQIKKTMEKLERDLQKQPNNKELNWKQKKQLSDIIQKHKTAKNKMKQLSDKLADNMKDLEKNKMLSAETIQKYKELQKLMKEVRSPHLEKLQKMREEALKKMSPEDLKKAMEQAKIDEEKFKKSIERTMNMLKRIQAEQKTDALTKRAEELKKKEDALNKKLNETDLNNRKEMNNLSKKQDKLKEETERLSKDLKKLKKLMEEIGKEEMPMDKMEMAQEALDKQDLQYDMKQASDQMKSGEKKKANKSQKRASKKLENFVKKMQDLKKEMQNKNSKEVIRKLQKAIDNMVDISNRQEEVKNKTKQAAYNSTKIPDYAREQAKLFDDLYNVAKELSEIANKSFAITQEMAGQITNSLHEMRMTMNLMTERRISQAAKSQLKSMQSINNALGQMQASLQQMQKQGEGSCQNPGGGSPNSGGQGGSSGMGMMGQQMQQMAAEQQALNQAMKEMMGNGPGQEGQNGKLSQEKRAQMKRMASQQKEMQKSMQQLAQEQKAFSDADKRQNKNGNKLANELKKIADEMKEISTDIEQGNITPETLKRQEKILSRLLDATNSVNKRDFEKKRESERAKSIYAKSPSGIDLSTQEGRAKAMRDLLQSLKQGYTKDYEQIIRRYFEKLSIEN